MGNFRMFSSKFFYLQSQLFILVCQLLGLLLGFWRPSKVGTIRGKLLFVQNAQLKTKDSVACLLLFKLTLRTQCRVLCDAQLVAQSFGLEVAV